MRGINIPPFPRKFENPNLENLFRARLSTTVVMWPDQALPLLCYMCFPNDEAARDDFLRTLWSWQDAVEPPAPLKRLGRIQFDWLRVADIFHLYCDLTGGRHQERRGGPSIGKAITLSSAKAKNWGTGESKLWELWAAYKDVAHLVTAASLICAEVDRRYRLNLLPHLALDPEQIIPFQMTMLMPDLVLAVAMDFQRVGLAIGVGDKIKSVIDPDTLWRIPTDIDLNIVLVPLPFRKLPRQDLVVLNNRLAGNRGRANRKPEQSATATSPFVTSTGPEGNE
jgi:hypothetical protein